MRSDALLNRAQLLDAASSVFLEHGITASLDIVIERAAVGRATFYRNFPDRAALIVALLDAAHTRLERAAARIRSDEHKVFKMFVNVGKALMVNPTLVDAWRVLGNESPEIQASLQRARRIFDEPVSIALAEGTLRSDFHVDEITIVNGMMTAVVRQRRPEARTELVMRVLTLIMAGLAGPKLTADAREEILQFSDDDALSPVGSSKDTSFLFLPVGRDGMPFHPALARGGLLTVGEKGQETQFEDFAEALDVLQNMDVPTWRKLDSAGHLTVVRGVGWKRYRTDDLASMAYEEATENSGEYATTE